jgi:hypothetical protein
MAQQQLRSPADVEQTATYRRCESDCRIMKFSKTILNSIRSVRKITYRLDMFIARLENQYRIHGGVMNLYVITKIAWIQSASINAERFRGK